MLCQYNEELCLMHNVKTKVSDNVVCLCCRLLRMQMNTTTPQVMLFIQEAGSAQLPYGQRRHSLWNMRLQA